jgi:hypothetical protein
MRSFNLVVIFVASFIGILHVEATSSFRPAVSFSKRHSSDRHLYLRNSAPSPTPAGTDQGMTNAARLARGLTPAPPLRRGSEFYCVPIPFLSYISFFNSSNSSRCALGFGGPGKYPSHRFTNRHRAWLYLERGLPAHMVSVFVPCSRRPPRQVHTSRWSYLWIKHQSSGSSKLTSPTLCGESVTERTSELRHWSPVHRPWSNELRAKWVRV